MKLTNRYRYRGIHRKWNDQLTGLEECRGREVRERKKRKLSAQFAERVLRGGGEEEGGEEGEKREKRRGWYFQLHREVWKEKGLGGEGWVGRERTGWVEEGTGGGLGEEEGGENETKRELRFSRCRERDGGGRGLDSGVTRAATPRKRGEEGERRRGGRRTRRKS